jgi:tetratricopeptide (TPR) repeat protein
MPDITAENIAQIINKAEKVEQYNYYGKQPTLPNSIRSISGFVGREDYLNELRKAYLEGGRCFVLHGIGGIGKTATALQFAGEISKGNKARVFVDMQGMSETPLSARDAMLAIVRQFSNEIPTDINDTYLKTLFVQFVQNQPTLIVLDNAEKKESVESLRQAKACFIVTSRQSFVLTGGKSLRIEQMSLNDTRKLLFEIASKDRFEGQADNLAYLAGYLPMTLKLLAALLAEDELETAANLIEKYHNKQELLKERVPDYQNLTVAASFELSYEKLSDEMKERWRQLSIFPFDFDESAIAAILNTSEDEAIETQKQLRRFSLLEVNINTRRFTLHDLIREFLSKKINGEELLKAKQRHAIYYQKLLHQIRAIKEQRDFKTALDLVDIEWINILIGYEFVTKLAHSDNTAAQLSLNYCEVIPDFIILRLTAKEFMDWQANGLISARRLNNVDAISNQLGNLGTAYINLGEYQEAIKCFEQVLMISQKENKLGSVALSLGNLGVCYVSLSQYRKAIELYERALILSRELNDKDGECTNLGNLGNVYDRLGETPKAIEYHKQALEISRELKDIIQESRHLSNLGIASFNIGEYEDSMMYFKQALDITRMIGDRRSEVLRVGNIGGVYAVLGEFEKAIENFNDALKIAEKIGDKRGQASNLSNLGSSYGKTNEPRKAINFYQQALPIIRKLGDKRAEGEILNNLGIAHYSLGETERACRLWHEGFGILVAIESPTARDVQQNLKKYCQSQ